jgi:hypothetical protein
MIRNFLSHYYEASKGPSLSLSDLPPDQADAILRGIRQKGNMFASKRADMNNNTQKGN